MDEQVTVVVVDDSKTMRQHLRMLLEELNYVVVAEGSDGAEVRELYEKHRPDLVTVDIVMPGKDGVEATRELLEAHPEARVVMCTGMSLREQGLACKKAGASQFLVKPFTIDSVRSALGKALAR